jgi:hypothetical protein
MPTYDNLDDYSVSTDTFKNVSGDGTVAVDTDLAVIELDQSGQLTSLRITTETAEVFDVVLRDQDGSNPTTVKTFVGSDLDEGDFEEPVVREVGASSEIAVINRAQLNDEDVGVNAVAHELEVNTTI